jgi:hypothetical protein
MTSFSLPKPPSSSPQPALTSRVKLKHNLVKTEDKHISSFSNQGLLVTSK